jgi:hypothetical protein
MSEPITNVEDAVREIGALPMPIGPERLTAAERDMVLALIEDAKPARTSLLLSFAEAVRNRREHDHPKWEDFYCLNLSSYMGERSGPVLRRLVDVEAENEQLRARVADLEAAPITIYRAEHPDSGITLGHYGTEASARAHCEATERRSWPAGTSLAFDWIRDALPEDEENGIAELVVTAGQNEESTTGYIVTPLELGSEYDPDGDE